MRIGIIAAMKEELESLKLSLEDIQTVTYGKLTYYTGTLLGHDVALILCGIGKVNATIGCTLLIDKHRPDFIINSGVAGGFSSSLQVGDIVVSTELRHHDADATAFDYAYGQIPQMPVAFLPDSKLIAKVLDVGNRLKTCRVVSGAIMSGDSFIHKDEQISEIKSKFPGIVACEMEGAAIAQTCYVFDVDYVVVRSISDLVFKDDSQKSYHLDMKMAAENSVELVKGVIKNCEDNNE